MEMTDYMAVGIAEGFEKPENEKQYMNNSNQIFWRVCIKMNNNILIQQEL